LPTLIENAQTDRERDREREGGRKRYANSTQKCKLSLPDCRY